VSIGLCPSSGLEGMGLLKSKGEGASKGEAVDSVEPMCICLNAATMP